MLAAVARSTGDLDLAEDCAQEAFAIALRTWQRDGVPERPGAWLTTTARNRALDRLRRRKVEAEKVAVSARLTERLDPDVHDPAAEAADAVDAGDGWAGVEPRGPGRRPAAPRSSPAATRPCRWRGGWRSPCAPSPV